MSCKQNSAKITVTLGAGATNPYFAQVNISQRLCSPACVDETPVFTPQFSLVGYSEVGTGQYVATIQVQGVIYYVPCGSNNCNTRTMLISQKFTIPFVSATAPTAVTITAGTSVSAVEQTACQSCSRDFVSETPITLSVS